ncbi:MAG: RNA polymerase sigma factor [Chloroflexota bacterium]|jgi:RNA polymerase sigma-70 factor (ECF subfamily)
MEDIGKVVRECQEGRLEAFDTLFNHYQHRVYDLACIIMRDDAAAEDVVQDTFLAVFQKIDGFKGNSSFETWLTAIAVNECRMRQRRRNIRQFLSLESLSPGRLPRTGSRQQDVADVVHRRQQRQTLWEMVDQLDDRLRLPIILRYHLAYSCGDIADILKRKTSTVYQQLNEGRLLLKKMQRQQETRQLAEMAERKRYPEAG